MWMHAMQEHRLACLQHLQQLLPPEQEKAARTVFGACAKPLAPLPMASFHVSHMAVSRDNGLESLCKGASVPTEKDFYKVFPNLRKLDRGCKCHFLRTDGVTACLVVKREAKTTAPSRKRKREQSKEDAANGGPSRGPAPKVPHENQRLVGIDPGRRDMVGVVSNEGDAFTVSTKSYLHMSGGRRYAQRTVAPLSARRVGDTSLYDLLQALPCRRDIDEWDCYLRSVLPILDTIIATYEVKRLRRLRFQSFMKRDRTLDSICARITASKNNVLVAFGDASSCHSGFGYAPAPQGRLRRRLSVIHGAQVTLVDEYNTSRYCCKCHSGLVAPVATHSLQKIRGSDVLTRKLERNRFRKADETSYSETLHGVRQCTFCWNLSGSPRFHHRDLNSAENMMDIYLSLASSGARPEAFSRS